MMAPKIITEYWPKPFPLRDFDWTAVEDGYEPGCPAGHGATEQEAIADLLEQLEDDADYAQWCEDEQRRDDAREGFES